MRKLPLIFSTLFFALPAAAQEAAQSPQTDNATEQENAPAAKPETAKPATEAPATASAAATVAAEAPPPRAKAAVPATTTVSGPEVAADANNWKFEYHGYIRAPMRVGMGKRDKVIAGQSANTLHSPIIPDDQFLSWQSTGHNKTDWAELYLSLGTAFAKGTVSIQGYNFADAAFSNPTTQLGISDGYIDLTPDLGYENFRLALRAGAFSNKYGSAGKYDAGEYDTYMFGRIHNAGEALHLEYDIDENNGLQFEHGIGFRKPDPNHFNNSRFTMLHHAHLLYKHTEAMQFSAHYLNSWTQEEERIADPGIGVGANGAGTSNQSFAAPKPSATSITGVPDGSMSVIGLDARFDLGAFGYFYAAGSRVTLKNAVTVARAIEVIHSSGGGEFGLGVVDNYLGPSCVDTQEETQPGLHGAAYYPQPTTSFDAQRPCSYGNGHVDTLLAQYEFSVTNFLQQSSGGQHFWGEGQDLILKLYGMYNKVKSDFIPNDGIHKLKFGTDLSFAALPWLSAGVRFDRLQPNSKTPEQSFAILSPRVVFKSKWMTREAITLQYSRYFYNQRDCASTASAKGYNRDGSPADGVVYVPGEELCVQPPSSPVPPDGFGASYTGQNGQRGAPTTHPDLNVFKVEATMWW